MQGGGFPRVTVEVEKGTSRRKRPDGKLPAGNHRQFRCYCPLEPLRKVCVLAVLTEGQRTRTPHHLSRFFQKVGALFSRWGLCPQTPGIYRFRANRASRGRLSRPPPTCRHLGQRSGRIPALPYPLPKRFPVYPILAYLPSTHFGCLPFSPPLRIIQRPGLQHRHQHRQPAIRYSPCRPPVTVAGWAQRCIMLLRCGILLHARARPVIQRVPPPHIAAITHTPHLFLAAFPRYCC